MAAESNKLPEPKGSRINADTCLVTTFALHSVSEGQEAVWLVKLMNLGMEFAGFLSAEIIPPYPPEQTEWKLVQRFRNPEQIVKFRDSAQRVTMLDEMAACFPDYTGGRICREEMFAPDARGSVATAIVTRVKSGMEASYRSWEGNVQVAQAKYPGYRGSFVQPPTSDSQQQWTTMLRFDTPEAMDNWFNSDERKNYLTEAGQFVASTDYQMLSNSFPGWFPVDKSGKGPPVYKTFMIVLLSVFPLVMLEIKFVMPYLSHLPAAPANFIGNVLSLAVSSWVTVPASINALGWWVMPADNVDRKATDLKGIAILCCIYALEIALLWNILS